MHPDAQPAAAASDAGAHAAGLRQWHSELSGALRVLHERHTFRPDWFPFLLLYLLLHRQWLAAAAWALGLALAYLMHRYWVWPAARRRIDASGLAALLLRSDPEVLARYGGSVDSPAALSDRLKDVVQQAQRSASTPWLRRLSIAAWPLLLAGVGLYFAYYDLFQLPLVRLGAYAAFAAFCAVQILTMLLNASAAQYFLYLVGKDVAASLGIPLEELLTPRKHPVERIAQRLNVSHTLQGGEVVLVALLFLCGILFPLIWASASFYYETPWLLAVTVMLLNCGGGVWSLIEAGRYRLDVRRALAGSDLPLRLALGQMELPRTPVLTLAKERAELELAAKVAASRLPAEIGLVSGLLGELFVVCYYVLAFAALLLLGLWSRLYSDSPYELIGAAIPLLLFPLLAFAYKRTIHAEELVRLLRLQQAG